MEWLHPVGIVAMLFLATVGAFTIIAFLVVFARVVNKNRRKPARRLAADEAQFVQTHEPETGRECVCAVYGPFRSEPLLVEYFRKIDGPALLLSSLDSHIAECAKAIEELRR